MEQLYEPGGGIVRRALTTIRGGETVRLPRGHRLTREDIAAFPRRNLAAFIANHTIEVWPADLMRSDGPPLELMLTQHGFGKFHLVEGRRLTEKPLEKEAAQALLEEHQKKRTAR